MVGGFTQCGLILGLCGQKVRGQIYMVLIKYICFLVVILVALNFIYRLMFLFNFSRPVFKGCQWLPCISYTTFKCPFLTRL
jgi:hypothetical protein